MWLPPVTITGPSLEPVTVDEVKTFLRIDEDLTDLDAQIAGAITGARIDAEKVTSTRFLGQTVELRAGAFCDLDHLPIAPIGELISIKYLDTTGAELTLDEGAYELFGAELEWGIRPTIGATWPRVRPVADAIRIRVEVGYGDELPESLRVKLLQIVRGAMKEQPVDLDELFVNDRLWL